MYRGLSSTWFGAICLTLAACEPAAPPAAPPPPPPPPPPAATVPAAAPAAAPAVAAEPAKPQLPAAIVVKDAALKTPESVLYDAEADVYLVSNINGKPTEADDNGTIIKIDHDGKVVDAAFIDGAKKEIKLNAPKGMAIVGETLYVADLDVVRMFDKKTGKAKGEIRVPKSTFLNDVAAAGNKLYVSDSGLKMGKDGLESTGTDAVFAVDLKAVTAKPVRANKDMLSPNGLLADDDGVIVATYKGAELYRLNKKGEREKVTTLPKGGLDGIVKLNDGTLLVSSWEGQAIYRGRLGGTFEPLLSGLTSPADIGFDSKRNRVLIPSFQTDTVTIQPLPELAPIAEPAPAPAAATEHKDAAKAPAAAAEHKDAAKAPAAAAEHKDAAKAPAAAAKAPAAASAAPKAP